MTVYADADDLIGPSLDDGGEDYTLPSGKVIRIRGLSRLELFLFTKDRPDNGVYERRVISACVLHPKLSEAKVEAWQRSSGAGGELVALAERIRELSGLSEGAAKSGVAEVRD